MAPHQQGLGKGRSSLPKRTDDSGTFPQPHVEFSRPIGEGGGQGEKHPSAASGSGVAVPLDFTVALGFGGGQGSHFRMSVPPHAPGLEPAKKWVGKPVPSS